MIALRIFTEEGIEMFHKYIQEVKNNPRAVKPELNSDSYSRRFDTIIRIDENRKFSNRFEMAKYLFSMFDKIKIDGAKIINERNLWTWIAYVWFDQICPLKNGERKVRETGKYICSSDYTDYYRHLIAFTYDVFCIHGDNSRIFLYSPVNEHNDFIEQLASRQKIISSVKLIETVTKLYLDSKSGFPKKGAQSRNRPGNVRRLISVFDQLELTYDIRNIDSNKIVKMLPKEFDGWK